MTQCIRYVITLLGFLIGALVTSLSWADEAADYLAVIAKVGPGANGSVEAREARDKLVPLGVAILPRLLDAMDTPNIVAANWYRSAFDDIVDHEFARPEPRWSIEKLKEFTRQPQHQGRSRRVVLGLLDRLEPAYREQLLPLCLDDPEFRNDAVEWTVREADRLREGNQIEAARNRYREAFVHARESEQVLLAARKLTEAGEPVDPIEHMGFVTKWFLLGPLDAPGMSGFDAKFAPEEQVNLEGNYPAKDQRTVKWTWHATADPLGQVNLIEALAGVREAVGYAYTEIQSPQAQSAQLRCSADDNLTVWLNGDKVLAQRQWLNGTRLDRFVTPIALKAGTNRVLVKICQGPQHVNPDVPNNWTFQLRFCDATGASVGCIPASSPNAISQKGTK